MIPSRLLAMLLGTMAASPALAQIGSVPHVTEHLQPVFTRANLTVVILAVFLVVLCVVLHYEGFALLNRILGRMHRPHRQRIVLLMLSLVVLHIIEIWLFAFGFFALVQDGAFGEVRGIGQHELLDSVYFSAVCYTTLGLGDLIPTGPLRFLVGTESLIGFLLITWSASFTYLEMERFWRLGGRR